MRVGGVFWVEADKGNSVIFDIKKLLQQGRTPGLFVRYHNVFDGKFVDLRGG